MFFVERTKHIETLKSVNYEALKVLLGPVFTLQGTDISHTNPQVGCVFVGSLEGRTFDEFQAPGQQR